MDSNFEKEEIQCGFTRKAGREKTRGRQIDWDEYEGIVNSRARMSTS